MLASPDVDTVKRDSERGESEAPSESYRALRIGCKLRAERSHEDPTGYLRRWLPFGAGAVGQRDLASRAKCPRRGPGPHEPSFGQLEAIVEEQLRARGSDFSLC
jgi:hypothetical protein